MSRCDHSIHKEVKYVKERTDKDEDGEKEAPGPL